MHPRAAPGRVGDDRVHIIDGEGPEVSPREIPGSVGLAAVQGERPAATLTGGHHRLDSVARQDAQRRPPDFRIECLLHAAGEQCDARPSRALGRMESRQRTRRRKLLGGQGVEHRPEGVGQRSPKPRPPGQLLGDGPEASGEPKPRRVWKRRLHEQTLEAVERVAATSRFGVGAKRVDQIPVLNARGTGRHARLTGEAVIEVRESHRRVRARPRARPWRAGCGRAESPSPRRAIT